MSRSPWFDAFFDPASLLVLFVSVIAGLIAAWWLFPAGIVLWLFMFMRILRDPSLRLNQTIQARRDLAPRFQTAFNQVQKTQVSIFNAISTASGSNARILEPVNRATERFVDDVYTVCKRYSPMENYRQTLSSRESLEGELARATEQLKSAADPTVRQTVQESIDSIRQRIEKVRDVCDQLDRFDAQLNNINNEMNLLLAEIIQAQALDAQTLRQRVPQLLRHLEQENAQLSTQTAQ